MMTTETINAQAEKFSLKLQPIVNELRMGVPEDQKLPRQVKAVPLYDAASETPDISDYIIVVGDAELFCPRDIFENCYFVPGAE